MDRSSPRTHGLTLMEVMIALAVLAIGLLTLFAHQYTLSELRASSLSRALQTVSTNNLVNLCEGTNWDELGRSERPWSLSRIQGLGGATNPPLSVQDLSGAGVLGSVNGALQATVGESGTAQLRYYVEYYRATANLDPAYAPVSGQPGLLDAQYASAGAFKTAFAASATACRIVPAPTTGLVDATLLTPGNPALIRVVVARFDPATASERTVYEAFVGAQTKPQ